MAALIQGAQFDRDELARLFESAVQSDRLSACKRYIDGIEVLIRRKLSPRSEVLRVYEALSGCTAPKTTLTDILSDISDTTRLARVLRRQTCRLLVHDGNADVPLAALKDIAACGDTGRLTAIDFLVTRRRPSAEQAKLVVQLANEMSNQKVLVQNLRRCDYIIRVLRLTDTLEQLNNELPAALRSDAARNLVTRAPEVPDPILSDAGKGALRIELIVSAADVKKNVSRLEALAPSEMARWLRVLHRASVDPNRTHTDKSRYVISNVLSNLARTFQGDIVVVQILATALDLEAMAAEPSEYIFDKLQRICIAAVKYGGAAYTALARGLALCVRRIDLHADESLPDGYDARLAGAARLFERLRDWGSLVEAVASLHDHTVRPAVAYLLVLFSKPAVNESTPNDCRPARQEIDRLMRLALRRSKRERIRLHEVYTLSFGACFDEREMSLCIDDSELDLHARMSAVASWAWAASSAAEAHNRCNKMVLLLPDLTIYSANRIQAFEDLLQQHAFTDIAAVLGIPLVLHEDDPGLVASELAAVLSAARYRLRPLQGIHAAYQAFRILRNIGDHFDAYCALQTMLLRARDLFGDSGVRFRAYRRALRSFMSHDLQLPQSLVQTAVDERYGRDEPFRDGLDSIVETISELVLAKPKTEVLKRFGNEFESLQDAMYLDPMLGLAAESVMALPLLAVYQGRVKHTSERRTALARLSSLTRIMRDIPGLDWMDELNISEKMMQLSWIATSLRASPAVLGSIDPHAAENVQGKPIQAMREYLSQHSADGTNATDATEPLEVPGQVICLSLSFDATDSLVMTRRERGSSSVTVRLPVHRTGLLANDKQAVTYSNAAAEMKSIIEEAGSIEVSEDTSSERERFWKLQYALDDKMQKVVLSIQRNWIGGFGALFSPRTKALEVGDDMLNGLRMSLSAHIPTFSSELIALSPAMGACIRDAALSGSFDQLQDLLSALFDNLVVQGASIPVDEMDLQALMADIRSQVRRFASPAAERENEANHIVLVCDRKASVIPWEMLPALQGCSVTRALSLNQVAEWAKQREARTEKHNEKVTVVLNPQGNLPRTQEKFDTEFRLRGWQGFIGTAPTREQFVDAFVKSSSLVYVGHGSGSMLAEPVAIRRLFLTPTAVYLFGCSSVAIQYPFFNKDIVTSYAVAGSRIVMGTLWNVKDKDCNRFTAEFLSRVFDDNEHAGKALWEARKACMLPYLTSAAWVLYGLP